MTTLTIEAARTRAAQLSAPSRPFLLGLVGAPGAGKSTFAPQLDAPVLPMDGFHLADELLDALDRRHRKGAPDTFDVAGYATILQRLRGGEDVIAPRFDRHLEAAIAGALPFSAGERLIVTEGNYLLHEGAGWQSIRPLLDEVWYLDVPDELRVQRLIARHEAHGRSHDEAVRWARDVDGRNAELISASRSRADAFIHLDPDSGTTQQGNNA